MDVNLIIPSLLTIIFGLPSLIAYFKSRKTQIVYLEDENINLFDTAANRFAKLTIQYDNITVDNKLYLLRGVIICNGNSDITEKRSCIGLSLEEGGKWLDFSVISRSKGLDVQHNINNDLLEINLGLFKRNEYFKFEGIFNARNPKFLFHHRIPNVPKIKKLYKKAINRNLFSFLPVIISIIPLVFSYIGLSRVSEFNIIPYNAKTNELIDKEILYIAKDFTPILTSLNKNMNGVLLPFRNSRNYDVTIAFKDSKTGEQKEIKTIMYFRKNFEWALFVSFSILMLFIIFYFYSFIMFLFTQRKFLKYLNE